VREGEREKERGREGEERERERERGRPVPASYFMGLFFEIEGSLVGFSVYWEGLGFRVYWQASSNTMRVVPHFLSRILLLI
jgi:hypothetical protein